MFRQNPGQKAPAAPAPKAPALKAPVLFVNNPPTDLVPMDSALVPSPPRAAAKNPLGQQKG